MAGTTKRASGTRPEGAQGIPRRFGVTIDCRDPLALAAFWRDVVDYQDDPAPEGYSSWAEYDAANCVAPEAAEAGATIVDPTGVGPLLYFQKVPEPKSVKNRESCSSRRGRVRDPGVGRRAGCNGSGGRRRRPDTAHIRRSERPVSSSSVIRREMNSAWFCENDAPGPCVALCPRTHLPRLARGSNCRPQSEYPLAAVSPRTPSPPSARGSTGRRQPDDALAAASPRIHTRTSSSTC